MKDYIWLLLLYSLPATQASVRLSLWRQFKRLGAIALKGSSYVMPDAPEHLESLQWLAEQVKSAGGEATLAKASEISGMSDRNLIHLFQEARRSDYEALLTELKACRSAKGDGGLAENFAARFQAVRRIDYFHCPAAQEVQKLFDKLTRPPGKKAVPLRAAAFQSRTWQTRPMPEVDRIASAWLIARFIDKNPRFVFSAEAGAFPGALRYDMPGAEFGHEGPTCTFETLLRRFSLMHEPGLAEIAAITHDADLDDGKFGRAEGMGLLAVFRGWSRMGWSDEEMLEHGFHCLDGLHRSLAGTKPLTKQSRGKRK